MPEQQEPYVIGEPRTEPHTLERRSGGSRAARDGDERVPVRRVVFWTVIGLVLVAGVMLFFLFADTVVPILRLDR